MLFVGAFVGQEGVITSQLDNIDPLHLERTICNPDDCLLWRRFIENCK